jgi:hypothetical protein
MNNWKFEVEDVVCPVDIKAVVRVFYSSEGIE